MRHIGLLLVIFAALAANQSQAQSIDLPQVDIPAKLTVDKAEEILLQNNLSIVSARFGVDAARAQRLIATYRPNPNLTLGGEQFNTARPFDRLLNDSNSAYQHTYTFRIDQPIETANKRGLRTQNAEYQMQASEAQVLDAVRQQIFQMKQAYYSALLARENLRVANENLQSIQNTEELIQRQVKGGNTPESELIKFQANRIQYNRDAVTNQLSYNQSLRDLLNLLGAHPAGTPPEAAAKNEPAKIELDGALPSETMALSLDELRAATASRPDVVAAERNVDAAAKAVDMARAQRSVDFTVGGEYQRVGNDNTMGVVVSVPLPIFNNHRGNIYQAEAQLQQAKAQLTQTRLQATTDVDKAFQAFTSNEQLRQIYSAEALTKSKESLSIVEGSYQKGAATLLDLLDARRTYNQTRTAHNQVLFDRGLSLIQLEQAAGKRLQIK